jgi:hypothetical protein
MDIENAPKIDTDSLMKTYNELLIAYERAYQIALIKLWATISINKIQLFIPEKCNGKRI